MMPAARPGGAPLPLRVRRLGAGGPAVRLVNTTLTPTANPLISFSPKKRPRVGNYSANSQPSG